MWLASSFSACQNRRQHFENLAGKMNSYRGVYSAVHAAVAGVCLWVLQHMEQLQAHIADYKQYAIPAVLAGLALLFRMSDALSKAIVEKIPLFSRILRRIISGKEFIEGDWSLIVVDMEKQTPLYFGFLRIDFKAGQPYVFGDDWEVDGSHALAFHSMQALYRHHTLQYWYEQGASLHYPDMRGYTEIFFFPKNALAVRHAGKFLDPNHTNDIRFYAKRLRYRMFGRKLTSKEQKLQAARQLWIELQNQIGYLRGRPISADFA
jgi:hypothetical protein